MDTLPIKRGRGRPFSDNAMVQISIRMSRDVMDAIDAIAEAQPEHDRARIIRDLIRIGLKHRDKKIK